MGLSAPVIVGERMYMLCEPHDLVCLRKADGKVLWVRRNSYAEAADEADRKNPAYAEAAAAVAKLDAIADALVAGQATDKLFEQKVELERQVQKAMKAVDGEKYKIDSGTDVGFSGFTPLTDGKCVWTWSASGVSPATTWTATASGSAWTAARPSSTASPPRPSWRAATWWCSCTT